MQKLLQQAESLLVPIEDLAKKPWRAILAYPRGDLRTCKGRIKEFKSLGIKQVEFSGNVTIGNIQVLGKGCTSIVVKAMLNGKRIALKIRRTDSNRPSVVREVELQKLANKTGVGPKVFASSRNVVAMELLDGTDILQWVKNLKGKGSTTVLRSRIIEILQQCFLLDSIGLDHGELSNLRKHVIVGDKAGILDFETASLGRRVSNVTATAQYLFIGGPAASAIRRRLGLTDVSGIIAVLRDYKKGRSKKSFHRILTKLKLL
ncbi:MAG: serine/threonine protein kinase [Thaumarchaeota archaeon]|nr:serine/threonine protein kinase [Nitrososphaerota archaeon]